MATRIIHCRDCDEDRPFEQRRVAKVRGAPWQRRRWFRCPVCGLEMRLRETDDGWYLPPAKPNRIDAAKMG